MSQVRVRFAPSPTGFLHVGGARTALFNWLWARHNNGVFVLRIEDTDVGRSTEESTSQILESMKWLGLDWDEGPFYQSERLGIYQEHLDKLRKSGYIYPAFETRDELDQMRRAAEAAKIDFVYNRASLNLSEAEVEERINRGDEFVWRFRVPDSGETTVQETLMGDESGTSFDNQRMGDFIITRPGNKENPVMPLYNFVCTVDDALMGITHVIRGVEHLPNAAKQVLMYNALGYDVPTFTHLPLIMKNNKKMSKRDQDADPRCPVSVSARRDIGFLKEATVNFIALLGCSFGSDEELMPVSDLISKFDLGRLNKSNANFDEDKYLHFNGWYLRNLPQEEVCGLVRPYLVDAGFDLESRPSRWIDDIIALVTERCTLLSDYPHALDFFFTAPNAFEAKGVKKAFGTEAGERLLNAAEVMESVESFDQVTVEKALRDHVEASGVGFGKIAQPIRLAVTGRMASPGLFEVLEYVGKEESISRVRRAAEYIASGDIPVG